MSNKPNENVNNKEINSNIKESDNHNGNGLKNKNESFFADNMDGVLENYLKELDEEKEKKEKNENFSNNKEQKDEAKIINEIFEEEENKSKYFK